MTDTRKAQLEIGVNAGPAEDGFKRVERAAKGMSDAVGKSGAEAAKGMDGIGAGADAGAKKLDKATTSIIASVQRTTAAMQAGEKGTAKYFEELANQRGVNADVLKPYLDGLRAVEKAQGQVGVSAKQTAAAMRGVPAQFTDIITSLQGGQAPMTVLLQQGGQLKDMFGGAGNAAKALGGYVVGLVNPFTVAAAAGGVLAFAYAQGAKEADEFRKALLLSGNAAGASVGQLSSLAESIGSGFGKNVGQAAAALTVLAASGGVGRASLKDFATTAIEAEKAFGIAAKDIAKNFADLAKDPLGATIKLNESMNYLTEGTYKQIKAAQDLGQDSKAAALAQDAYNSALKGRSAEMLQSAGTIEKAWSGIKSAATGAWDAMLGVGRPVTIASQLGLAQKNLAAAVAKRKTVGDDTAFAPALDKEIAKLKEQVSYVGELDRITKRAGDSAAEAARQTKARVEADKEGLKYASDGAKMQKEIAQQVATLRQAKASEAEIEQRIAQIKASYAKKDGGTSGGESELTNLSAKIKLNADYLESLRAGENQTKKATEAERVLAKIKEELSGKLSAQARANKLAAQTLAEKALQQEREIAVEEQSLKIIKESAEERRKLYEEQAKNTGKLQAEVEKQREQNAAIGLTAAALGELASRRYDDAAAAAEQKAQTYALIDPQIAAELTNQAELYRELAELKRAGGTKQAAVDTDKAATDAAKKVIGEFDSLVGAIDASKLNGLFGGAIDGALKFATSLNVVADVAQKTEAALAANAKVNSGDGAKRASEEARILAQSAHAQISAYGGMAAGLKSYAKEGSKAYAALHTAEKVFRAFELASALSNMATKSGLFAAFVGTKVAGDAVMTASGTTAAAADIAATAAVGQAKAISGVANQAGGDPYSAFPRMATMAAIMAGLGFVIGGIGGGGGGGAAPTNSGTGTVFGDSSAQSESINNSLDLLNNTQDIALVYSKAMAASLRTIESNIGGLTNIYLRTGGTSGLTSGIATGSFDTGLSSLLSFGSGILGSAIGGIIQSINKALFGKKISITGSGISANAQTLSQIQDQGFQGNYYADVQTKKKLLGITYSTKSSTSLSGLDPTLEQQISAVFKGIGSTVGIAAELLGQDTAAINQKLRAYVVNIGRIDTAGLSGDKISEKLSAVFGAESDKLAASVIPGFENLQKVGEGYFETLSRMASQFELVTVYMDRLNDSIGATGINGAKVADSLIEMFGGVDAFQSSLQDYYETFYTEAERTTQTQKDLAKSFEAIGKPLPSTIQGFRDLVNAQDLTSEAGRATYAALIALAPAFAETTNSMTDTLKSLGVDATGFFEGVASSVASARQSVSESVASLTQKPGSQGYDAIKAAILAATPSAVDYSPVEAAINAPAAAAAKAAAQGQAAASAQAKSDAAKLVATAAAKELAQLEALKVQRQASYASQKAGIEAVQANWNAWSYGVRYMISNESIPALNKLGAEISAMGGTIADAAQKSAEANSLYAQAAAELDNRNLTYATFVDLQQKAVAASQTAREVYAAQVRQYVIDASKSVEKLKELREQTVAYHDAQKALADSMLASASNLRQAVYNSRVGQLTGAQSLAERGRSFDQNYILALSTSGAVQAAYADKLTAALPTLADSLKSTASSRADWVRATAELYSKSDVIAKQLEASAPQNYQSQTLDLLGQIDTTLANIDAAATSAEKIISDAIYATGDKNLTGLRAIVAALRGETVPAFAAGGYHKGGIRLVGENGPELEVTGASNILNASATASILSGAGQGGAMAELRAMREEIAALRAEARSTAVSTDKTAKILDRVTQGTDTVLVTNA